MKSENWQRIKEIFFEILDAPEDRREELLAERCGADADLRREIETMLAAHYESENFIAKPVFEIASVFPDSEANPAGKIFGHYRIVREIGVGGMGAVFLAQRADGEFEHQVAIKIVRQTVADSEVINRFRRERQILASLHHPNIAQLVDGGVSEDGLPFIAMEYIEGEPVTEYAGKNNLSVEERLRLFLKICSGVAYAHRNLIVHRDLKPSNVLITPDGEPKLLDFGLAKLLDDSLDANSAETQTAFRALTLAYASPEQLRGEKITTASDIYSLGVILYELLASDRPFHFKNQSIDEAIHVVCDTSPTRPSEAVVTGRMGMRNGDNETVASSSSFHSLNPSQLKGDLDNIVLMAMRKEPERRYPTVEKFAEDIERHLHGLPVMARSATVSYRAEKFIKRHYWGVTAALLILLSLLGGLGATIWQSRRAESERERAERRFNEVRKLSQSLMFEIHDSVQALQGSTPTRRLIVSRALEYLNSLAQEAGDDPTLQRELATAYQKIGDIQGNPYLSNLGDTGGALESYHRAAAIREELAAADSQNIDLKRELATSYDLIGDVLGRTGDRKGAIEVISKSIAIRQQLIAENSGDAQLRFEMATSRMKIGEHLHSSGELDAALENERQALAAFESIAAQDAQNVKAVRGVMVASNKIAYMVYIAGDPASALEYYRKGFDIAETLAAKNPDSAPAQRDLSICLNNLGRIYLKQKNSEAAQEAFGKSLAISQKLAANDPKNVTARSDMAYALVRLGAAQFLAGQYRASLDSQRQAIVINEALLSENPKNMLPSSEIADSHNYMGEAFEKMGDLKAALESYRQAANVREKNSATDPNDAQFRQSVAVIYQTLGRIYSALATDLKSSGGARVSHLNDARNWYQRSLDIWQELNSRKPLSGDAAANITTIQNELIKCDAALAKL